MDWRRRERYGPAVGRSSLNRHCMTQLSCFRNTEGGWPDRAADPLRTSGGQWRCTQCFLDSIDECTAALNFAIHQQETNKVSAHQNFANLVQVSILCLGEKPRLVVATQLPWSLGKTTTTPSSAKRCPICRFQDCLPACLPACLLSFLEIFQLVEGFRRSWMH